jgi:hypothetical protein
MRSACHRLDLGSLSRPTVRAAGTPLLHFQEADALMDMPDEARRKVHNITQRPAVTLHFNSDPDGGDVVVITGHAAVRQGQRPSALDAYLDKYEASITGPLGTTVDEVDRTYDTEVRITPTRVRLTDTSA